MAKPQNQKRIFTFALGCLLIFLILFFQNPLRSVFYGLSQPIQSQFFQLGKQSADFLKGLFYFTEIVKVNQQLQQENIALLARLVETEELRKENQDLRAALGLGLGEQYKLLEADVFSRDISQDFILINKGREQGLEPGMAVIDFYNVLIGRVDKVYQKQAKVILISNKAMKFSVEAEGKRIDGLAKGRGGGELILDLVPKETQLTPGALLTTAGFEDGLPRGRLVGKLTQVEKSDLFPFQKAKIEPLVEIDELSNLLIILEQ